MFLTTATQKKYERWIEFGYFLCMVGLGIGGSLFGPLMLRLSESVNRSVSDCGSYIIFLGLGFLVTSILLARLYDRFPGNKLVSFGLIAEAVLITFIGRVSALWQLFTLAFLLGIASGIVDVGISALIPWLLGERCKPAMNFIHLCYSLGAIITPLLIGKTLQTTTNIGGTLVLLSCLLIPPAVFICFLPSPMIPKETKSESSEKGKAGSVFTVMALFGMVLFFASGSQQTSNNWVSTVALQGGMTDEAGASFISSIYWIGILSSRALATFLADRLSSFALVSVSLIVSFINALVMRFSAGNLNVFRVCTFISGMTIGPIIANIFLLVKERIVLSGKLNGILFTVNEVGVMLIPWLLGKTAVGANMISYYSSALMLFSFCAFSLVLIGKKKA